MTPQRIKEAVDELLEIHQSIKPNLDGDKQYRKILTRALTTLLAERAAEVRRKAYSNVVKWAYMNKFDVDEAVNDPTNDFIAEDAYESKVEAFYEGYNQALKELTAHYTTT